MNILGLHFAHDGGAAIVKGNKLVVAVSSERITREKKFYGITDSVIDYVLKEAGLSIDQIDLITFTDFFDKHTNGTCKLFRGNLQISDFSQQLFDNNLLDNLFFELKNRKIPAICIPHHLAHASAAFYTSPFNEAVCFSLDSSMGKTESNSLIAWGRENKIASVYCPHLMIGPAYTKFTFNLGLGNPLHKAGSTMGLASYGKPKIQVINNIQDYVARSFSTGDYEQTFQAFWREISGSDSLFPEKNSPTKESMDIAASIQYIFEESILHAIKSISNNHIENICLSGGSMLNCNVNSRIQKETQFKNLHLFPACGDDGLVVGSALYAAHNIFNEPRYNYQEKEICYLGQSQSSFVEPDYEDLANEISKGKIVAWFNGRSEYGPRALGNRSILADPRNFHNRELLNFVIKNREWFRPFAPVVLEEECSKWFDWDYKSPFMLFTAQVKNVNDIPAVSHIDGSARMQTINKETNEPYYNLVKAFGSKTNVPMLVNTSLNNREPILETEADAENFFATSPVDIMVVNGNIICR